MIKFENWELSNGLKVILNQDLNTPLVTVNLMYNVGAKDENPSLTGMAHLFEHLMFSGSKNALNFDTILQNAGGENNAFTSNDLTNYYVTLPIENLETALWLESDRMQDLVLTQEKLDVQKKVVIEEFKQRYFNQPYGDVWLKLRPLCYQKHPYQWPTIGKSIEQIESVTLQDALKFYKQFYAPNNATLSIVGNIELTASKQLVERYFGSKTPANIVRPTIFFEDLQTEQRSLRTSAKVPFNAIYIAFPVEEKESIGFYTADLLTDILSGGSSSRLYQSLVKDQQLFTEINSFLTGENHPGLFVISGKTAENTTVEKAEIAVWSEIENLIKNGLEDKELKKVINKKLTADVYGEMQSLNKAIKLAFFSTINKLEDINQSMDKLKSITETDILNYCKSHLQKSKSSILYYLKTND